ncbi:uncharacterized protein LOC133735542 [Rosa rugosa]|uniref:uncharacterized protein LOC133735542 n=1 Tax=Rosa rugosa TaxID=74645 RepID=UPI002B401FE2|nr:uncharacterized protein LOC133735542 [Rosa rugosa]
MFKLTRFRENKKTWVGDVAENAYGEMTKLKNPEQPNEESEKAMSDDEIYDKVLSTIVGPPPLGYIRGLGAGPKPKNSKVSNNHSQLQEATRRADEAERRSTQLEEELEAMKASAAQQNEELEAVKASAAQQNEQLEAVKAKQNETDALLKKLLEQFSSRK